MTSIQFLTMGFGPAVRAVWPFSGLGVFCLLLLSAAVLAIVVRNQPRERNRALGLLLFLGAMASLALGLGLGRDGFEPRYITLSVPVWCCVYFVWELYGHRKINFSVRMLLLLITCLTLWPNTQFGLAYARDLRARLGSFERDMAAGMPSYKLINRYGAYLHPHHDIPDDYMPMLHRAGVGKFRFLRENPAFHEVSVPLVPSDLNQVRWEKGTAYGTGNYPFLVFTLPENRYVCGIRLKYSYRNKEGTAPYVSIYWKGGDQDDFTQDQFWKYSPTGDRANWERGTWARLTEPESTMTVWVCDTVKQLRIHPDFKPGVFTISELVLLVPGSHTEAAANETGFGH